MRKELTRFCLFATFTGMGSAWVLHLFGAAPRASMAAFWVCFAETGIVWMVWVEVLAYRYRKRSRGWNR